MSFITLLFTATLLALSSAAPYYYPGSISSPSDYYPFEDFARARSQFSVSWSPGEKAFLQGVLNELTENEKAILQRITVSWGNKEKALLQGLLDDLNEDEKAALQRFSVSWNREWASRQQAVPDYNQLFKIFRGIEGINAVPDILGNRAKQQHATFQQDTPDLSQLFKLLGGTGGTTA